MMNPISVCLIVTQLLVITTSQLSGRFARDLSDRVSENATVIYDVDRDGDVRLTVELRNGRSERPSRSSRGQPFPLTGGQTELFNGFIPFFNYSINFGRNPSRGRRGFLRPVRRLIPSARLQEGDLTSVAFSDSTFGLGARIQGRSLGFTWETLPLSPGEFRFRQTTDDLHEVTFRVESDGRAEIQASCRGSGIIRGVFGLGGLTGRPLRYAVQSVGGSSIEGFRSRLGELCGTTARTAPFGLLLFADANTMYVSYAIPGRDQILLPLDRVAN
ncbi:hypothetical protein FOZ63_011176 [Perkinsus olseni]|uniref:GTP-binding protein 10 n=1 Tax=Perkinsus olseni TaxID=32597 RepID=A0A7J6QJ74_PEROL|nr:hypothetical protein FOZ63_011176 [Perkinsus olseni]